MVYEQQMPSEETTEQAPVRPAVVSATDEWLARISDQLQVFVDMAQADTDQGADDGEDSGEGDTGSDEGQGNTPADQEQEKPAAKKTTAKRAEVRGN